MEIRPEGNIPPRKESEGTDFFRACGKCKFDDALIMMDGGCMRLTFVLKETYYTRSCGLRQCDRECASSISEPLGRLIYS